MCVVQSRLFSAALCFDSECLAGYAVRRYFLCYFSDVRHLLLRLVCLASLDLEKRTSQQHARTHGSPRPPAFWARASPHSQPTITASARAATAAGRPPAPAPAGTTRGAAATRRLPLPACLCVFQRGANAGRVRDDRRPLPFRLSICPQPPRDGTAVCNIAAAVVNATAVTVMVSVAVAIVLGLLASFVQSLGECGGMREGDCWSVHREHAQASKHATAIRGCDATGTITR